MYAVQAGPTSTPRAPRGVPFAASSSRIPQVAPDLRWDTSRPETGFAHRAAPGGGGGGEGGRFAGEGGGTARRSQPSRQCVSAHPQADDGQESHAISAANETVKPFLASPSRRTTRQVSCDRHATKLCADFLSCTRCQPACSACMFTMQPPMYIMNISTSVQEPQPGHAELPLPAAVPQPAGPRPAAAVPLQGSALRPPLLVVAEPWLCLAAAELQQCLLK